MLILLEQVLLYRWDHFGRYPLLQVEFDSQEIFPRIFDMRIDLVFLLFLNGYNHLDNTVFEIFVKVIHLLIPKHFDWMEVFLQNKLILLLLDWGFPLKLATTSNTLTASILFVRGAETIAFPNTNIIILIIIIDLKVLFIKLFILIG